MAKKKYCNLCNVVLSKDIEGVVCLEANKLSCLTEENKLLHKEVSKLKTSVSEWKDAWFNLEGLIGELHWNHPAINDTNVAKQYQVYNKVD